MYDNASYDVSAPHGSYVVIHGVEIIKHGGITDTPFVAVVSRVFVFWIITCCVYERQPRSV